MRYISVCGMGAALRYRGRAQPAASYPHFDKKESFAAHAAAVHLLLSVATKVGKSAFCLPKQ